MSCLCSQNLSKLVAALPATPPSVGIPAPLAQLGGMLDGSAAARGSATGTSAGTASMAAAATANMGLSASAMANITAMANATSAVKAGFGFDLTEPGAAAKLALTMKAANANLAAMKPLMALDPAPWLALAALAALAARIKAAFGVGLFGSATAATALGAAMSAVASGSANMKVIGSGKATMAASSNGALGMSAKAMGVSDLSARGAMEAFAAKLQAVAGLSIPALAVPASALMAPIAILGAIAAIAAHLGVNPLAPGFPAGAQALSAKLSAFESLKIDSRLGAAMAGTATGTATASGTATGTAAAKVAGTASANVGASALGNLAAPNLAGVTALAGFSNCCAAAGFPVARSSPCGPSCAMGG